MANKHLRTNRVSFVITDKELKMLQEKSEKEELTVSEYIRNVAVYGRTNA